MNNEISPNEIRDKRIVGEISLNCCITTGFSWDCQIADSDFHFIENMESGDIKTTFCFDTHRKQCLVWKIEL